MIAIRCSEHFAKVVEDLQDKPQALKQLMNGLSYLCNYSDKEVIAELYSDFAKNSFTFSVFRVKPDDSKGDFWFNGGLIYFERDGSYSIHT